MGDLSLSHIGNVKMGTWVFLEFKMRQRAIWGLRSPKWFERSFEHLNTGTAMLGSLVISEPASSSRPRLGRSFVILHLTGPLMR